MLNTAPIVVCYKRDKKFYWSIKSKGYESEKEARDAIPSVAKVFASREKNTVYNGIKDSDLKKGEKNHGEK